MGHYLVKKTTDGAVNGCHVKTFVEGETVALYDADLAAVGVADGWLVPVDEPVADLGADWIDPLTGAAGDFPEDYAEFVMVDPARWPLGEGGAAWRDQLPAAGEVFGMSAAAAADLVESGVIAPKDEHAAAIPLEGGTPGGKKKKRAAKE